VHRCDHPISLLLSQAVRFGPETACPVDPLGPALKNKSHSSPAPRHSSVTLVTFISQPGGQLLIHMPAMANGYEADDARLAVDGVDNPKAADAVFPESVEFAE
jgi:hypothetical protein